MISNRCGATRTASFTPAPALSDVELSVDLPLSAGRATVLASDGKRTDVEVTVAESRHTVRIDHLGLYTVVLLAADDGAVRA